MYSGPARMRGRLVAGRDGPASTVEGVSGGVDVDGRASKLVVADGVKHQVFD